MVDRDRKVPQLSLETRKVLIEILRTAAVIVIALLLAFVIILLTSQEPVRAMRIFLQAPFISAYNFGQIITQATPLIFTGVAVSIMVRCGQFNLFVEGAFFIGMFVSAIAAAGLPLPGILLPMAAMLIPSLLAGLVGYIPAKLKSALKVNEFVSSLMFNFIVFWVCMFLFSNYFRDPTYSSLATPTIPDHGRLFYLSASNEISSSFIIALLVAGLGWFFLSRTRWGYNIRLTGENPDFARYAGINTQRAITWSQVLGAALAGLGGAAFELGNFYRFNLKALPNYGFDGFIVAIVARNNPLLVPIAALFLGYLRAGASQMALYSDVTNDVVYIIQAVMLILVGGQAFFSFLKERAVKKAALAGKETREAGGEEDD